MVKISNLTERRKPAAVTFIELKIKSLTKWKMKDIIKLSRTVKRFCWECHEHKSYEIHKADKNQNESQKLYRQKYQFENFS